MDFLLEIGLEEVPARMIAGAQAELQRRLTGLLQRERLVGESVEAVSYSTPRRLGVLVRGVAERQEDLCEEITGPAVKIAYKDGVPGPAAVAFAKKNGVAVEVLKIVSTPKGEYIAATSVKPGRSASEVIAAELPKELVAIYWAKNMVWRAGKPERFVRPVRWLVALLGDEVVPVSFGGYEAGRVTYGHRVLFGASPIVIASPESYLAQLSDAFVMADVELRRHTIRKALDRVCRTIPGTRWREDHPLVDKMTHLTEWPSVIAGTFEAEFLALPEEVLVTVMRDHQNEFAVESEDGKLAPHFLAVLNTVADEAGEAVIRHGNERVLRARFNDARFFWEFDQRIPLADRVALLENVTFQKDLGSYAKKSERVRALAAKLGELAVERGLAVDLESLATASRLAKTDLTTELVKEFTELQGEVGGLYAKAQGFPAAVSDAIYDQYRPTSMEDRIPRTVEGQILAIADKADTIAGMFGLGMEPTGSKDPFALRRAANGIVKILGEGAVSLQLDEISETASSAFAGITSVKTGAADKRLEKIGLKVITEGASDGLPLITVESSILTFLCDRLSFYLETLDNVTHDVVNAVGVGASVDVKDTIARAKAVGAARGSQDFISVCAAFKRMSNILGQSLEKGMHSSQSVDWKLFRDPTENALGDALSSTFSKFSILSGERNYLAALQLAASLRPQIDAFFEGVMVLDDDPAIRANRLALLGRIVSDFSGIADFSEIVVAG